MLKDVEMAVPKIKENGGSYIYIYMLQDRRLWHAISIYITRNPSLHLFNMGLPMVLLLYAMICLAAYKLLLFL